MTEIFERRAFFAFAKYSALLALLISTFALCLTAQVDTAEESVESVAGTRAKLFAVYGTNRSDWVTVAVPAAMSGAPYTWRIRKNQAGAAPSATFNFGLDPDDISPGSFTGDTTYDLGMYRYATGSTWIDPFDNGPGEPYTVIPFGTATDNPGFNGDYDGDGIDDITIVRVTGANNNLQWWIRPSSNPSAIRVIPFGHVVTGQRTFAFQGADFTGDGRDEIVVARSVNLTGAATWYVADSVTGAQILQVPFGDWDTDYLINPADYTGDGIADIPVWRAGGANSSQWVWYIRNTANGSVQNHLFGIGDPNFTNADFPVRGDYDGDGTHDVAIWRPSTQTFWVRASSDGSLIIQQWGLPGDTPLGTFFAY